MKTIKELNQKWLYRLSKVIFLVTTIVCFIFSILIIFSEYSPKSVKDYKIVCAGNYTNKSSFYARGDKNINIFPLGTETIYESLSLDDKKKIRESCDISDENSNLLREEALVYVKEQVNFGVDSTTIQKNVDDKFRPYKIMSTERVQGDYKEVVRYSLLSLLLTFIIIEIIKRTIYYIVLGKVNPEK